MDEPAQWPASQGERFYRALETSAGKVPGCRRYVIGTRPAHGEHWFEGLLRGGADVAMVYAADREADPFDRETWLKANLSLAYLPDLELAIEDEAERARKDPGSIASQGE